MEIHAPSAKYCDRQSILLPLVTLDMAEPSSHHVKVSIKAELENKQEDFILVREGIKKMNKKQSCSFYVSPQKKNRGIY